MRRTNQANHDLAVAKQLYLERLKDGYANRAEAELKAYLARVLAKLRAQLARVDFANMSKGSLDAIKREFRAIERTARPAFRAQLLRMMREFARLEMALAQDIWNEGDEPLPTPTKEDEDKVWALIWNTTIGDLGESLGDMVELFVGGISASTIKALAASHALNETPGEALERLDRIEKSKASNVRSVMSTAIQAAASVIFLRNGRNLSPKYIWISILDSHTSKTCKRLSGQIFLYGCGPIPPAHPHCRSTIATWRNGGGPIKNETLTEWTARQSPSARKDLTSNQPLTLEQYAKKVRNHEV